MTHILRTHGYHHRGWVTSRTPAAPLAFSMATASPGKDFYRHIAAMAVSHIAIYLKRYMGDITLVVAPDVEDKCSAALRDTLTEAGMSLNENKCTAWTTGGGPPDTPLARTLWVRQKTTEVVVCAGSPQHTKHAKKKHRWPFQVKTQHTLNRSWKSARRGWSIPSDVL